MDREIKLRRIARRETYTIGKMFLDTVFFCNTLEDRDRFFFGEKKVKGSTAIPAGRYEIDLNTVSPRFGGKAFYKETCEGRLPKVKNVPHFDGVLIHCGNKEDDTDGCILVGENKVVGQVINSKATFRKLAPYFNDARKKGDRVFITIE